MMRPEDKAAWVAALRSGDFEQASGGLNRKGGYCCLGVQCELSDFAKSERTNKYKMTVYLPDQVDCSAELYPSAYMLELWGLDQEKMFHLAKLNDAGVLFAEIADIIEQDDAI